MRFVAIIFLCTMFACLAVAQDSNANTPASSVPLFRLTDALLILVNLLMIWAVLQAPKAAIKAQWELQQRQEQRNRRLWVFKTLMATRATVLDVKHVQALNMIDVEFNSPTSEDAEIRSAWKEYLDHLNLPRGDNPDGQRVWDERSRDFFAELLNKDGRLTRLCI